MTTSDAPLSEDVMVWLSAYVDGVLNESDRARVEEMAAGDPRIAVEIDALFALNADLAGALDGLLDQPLPETLAAPADPAPAVQPQPPAPASTPANTNAAPRWQGLAAMLALGLALGAGGMWALRLAPSPQQQQIAEAPARSWLAEVAEYHQVYARQKRHLVEVPASEKAHIEKWLGKETGLTFRVPDLASSGWTFQGARLLVAAGKPVAQLIYTDADGQVIALCALKNGSGTAAAQSTKSFDALHMVTWKSADGSFALVGEETEVLRQLARQAETEI